MPRTQMSATVFVQLGPERPYVPLTCCGVGDMEFPAGDAEIKYKPGPRYGEWVPAGILRGTPGPKTTSLNFYLQSTRASLMQSNCPMNLRVNFSCAGSRSDPTNYDSALVLVGSVITRRSISSPISLEPTSDFVQVTADYSAPNVVFWGPPVSRELYGQGAIIAAVAEPEECASECASGVGYLENNHAVSTSNYLYSLDGGNTWTTRTLPSNFTPTCIASYGGRVIIGGALQTNAAVAYTDNRGNSFVTQGLSGATVVDISIADSGHIWLVTNNTLYRSSDRGQSWTVMMSLTGGETFRDVISRANRFYAITGSRLISGPPITSVTVSGLVAVDVNWGDRVIGMDDTGNLYRVYDGEVTNYGNIGFSPNYFRFSNDRIFGIAVSDTAAAITEDGGVSWRALPGVVGNYISVVSGPAWLISGDDGIWVVEPRGEEE